jgi:hypothetical protein
MRFINPALKIFVIVSIAAVAAGCTFIPKASLTDSDIPSAAGTSYTAYQNPLGEPVEVTFSNTGPWDFSRGPTSVTVKSVLVRKDGAAANKQFPEADYAEKVLPSSFTSGFTAYNYTSLDTSSLSSYGQSVTPGPDGPIVKTYDKPERLLKLPAGVGDEWTDVITLAEKEPVVITLNRKVIARGQVKVPAGSFYDCFMVRLLKTVKAGESQPSRTIMYFWWAPNVGLVAAIGSQPDETKMSFTQADYLFRLKSYKIAD